MSRHWKTLADERFWQRLHTGAALVWLALTPPALLWWTESVAFLVYASLWANVVAHAGGALSARAGRRANPEDPL